MSLKREPHDPTCRKCGHKHFNFQPCHEHKPAEVRFTQPVQGDFRVSSGWGVNVPGAKDKSGLTVTFQMSPRPHLGKLTLPPETAA